ncbi:hypothetical protein BgiBS90_017434 [Biomphalaria glabrata]|nr:hypothetical protein BgiBS90_017434 [Biomphalaria glabrata]
MSHPHEKANCHFLIWLFVTATIHSICAFDILLGHEFTSGPFKLKDESTNKNWGPFSFWWRSRRSALGAAQPRQQHISKTKYLELISKASKNDAHGRAKMQESALLLDKPNDRLATQSYLNSLIRDLSKLEQRRQIVNQLRRRNNIPTSLKSWKKKPARKATRSSGKHQREFVLKQSQPQTFQAAIILPSQDDFLTVGDKPSVSGNEFFDSFIPSEANQGSMSNKESMFLDENFGFGSEPASDPMFLDQALGFEDISITPTEPIDAADGFGQFSDLVDAPVNSRELRKEATEGDGWFLSESTGCSDITSRVCTSDSECSCHGFYTCVMSRCRLLDQQGQSFVSVLESGVSLFKHWYKFLVCG